MGVLHEVHVQGVNSIRDPRLEPGPLNVFTGLFHFLDRVARQQLQTYSGEAGGADTLLHFGR